MVQLYLNYPVKHATLHGNASCGFVPDPIEEGRRWVYITPATFAAELDRFRNKAYRLGSAAELNDMWLAIAFDDRAFKRAGGEFLIRVLARHYGPFRGLEIREHC